MPSIRTQSETNDQCPFACPTWALRQRQRSERPAARWRLRRADAAIRRLGDEADFEIAIAKYLRRPAVLRGNASVAASDVGGGMRSMIHPPQQHRGRQRWERR